MIKVKPRFVYDEKEKVVGVVLESKVFDRLIEELEDYHDYLLLQKRRGKKEKLYSLEQVMRETRDLPSSSWRLSSYLRDL